MTGVVHTGLVVDESEGPLFMISDVHAGALSPAVDHATMQEMTDLLRIVDRSNGRLIILGDLFDFWQESGQRIPEPLRRWVNLFRELIPASNPVILITGNHDHWAGPTLAQCGFELVRDHVMVTTSGRPWLLIHGDGLPYKGLHLVRRGLNKAFRNVGYNAVFRLLPLRLRISIMEGFSTYRKKRNVDKQGHQRIHERLADWLQSSDFQGVVYGHTHERYIRNINGKHLVNTGTFYSDATVMVLDQNVPKLTSVAELKATHSAKMTYISPDGTRR